MVKVISLSEKAYGILKRNKKENMSFSDIIVMHMDTDKNRHKTENIQDLLRWIKLQEKGIKNKIKIDHDLIAYGVRR